MFTFLAECHHRHCKSSVYTTIILSVDFCTCVAHFITFLGELIGITSHSYRNTVLIIKAKYGNRSPRTWCQTAILNDYTASYYLCFLTQDLLLRSKSHIGLQPYLEAWNSYVIYTQDLPFCSLCPMKSMKFTST